MPNNTDSKAPYETGERLKNYLDTNQLSRERMCLALLSIDKRFSNVRPRHPNGGADGGRDIQAIYQNRQTAFGAVGFVNEANDSTPQKTTIKKKFASDLESALAAEVKPEALVFFTNINLTIEEKNVLVKKAQTSGIVHCEIWDRERLRIQLDSLDGLSIRFQYLLMPLSEAEQASFFARWGDDIQSVIATGFQRTEQALDRVQFFLESQDALIALHFTFELDRVYTAAEINHFRVFCSLMLLEPKLNIWRTLFGAFDKAYRLREKSSNVEVEELPGIAYGIGYGQWNHEGFQAPAKKSIRQRKKSYREKYNGGDSGSAIGRARIDTLNISLNHSDTMFRFAPTLALKDFNNCHYKFTMNRSFSEKVKAIHVYANGFKLDEITSNFRITSDSRIGEDIPMQFTEDELRDEWVVLEPKISTFFALDFNEQTPKRMYPPRQTPDSLVMDRITIAS